MKSVYSNTNESNSKHVYVWGSILQIKSKTKIQHSAFSIQDNGMQNVLRSNNFLGSLPYSTPSFSIFPLLSNLVITYQCIQHICLVFHQGVTIFYLIYGTIFTLNNIKLFRFIERLYMLLKVITNEK